MASFNATQLQAIGNCRKSVTWFLRNFGKIKHPAAGILPFEAFGYQRMAIKAFRTNRMNIFKKCRQSGISKISGAFALWFAMFHPHKTILIVSRTDEDAMAFLREHIVFLFEHLPAWMKAAWKPTKQTDHSIVFPNNSIIRSLTSHPDVLRSNASSLNIIDEAAFIQGMDVMWAGGFSTLQHGGNVIVISTTNGVGNWYWSTWTDAEAGVNKFNPIKVDWWDMDWAIEYYDSLSREQKRIAPLDGIRECSGRLEREKYGPYWSPWLEDQWRGLQERGEGWKFEQEVLAHFIGSGNTVLDKSVLFHINTTVRDPVHKAASIVTCIHPMTGEEMDLDFRFDDPDEGLWIWQRPVLAKPMKRVGNTVTDPGAPAHSYVAGVDIASGKSKDYHAIEVFDVDTMEQVAEFMARCLPRELVRIIDWIGRYYNNALLVVESNNGGNIIIDELRYGYSYPKLWRKKDINDKPRPPRSKIQRPMKVANYGFNTNQSSKATLNKYLIDNLRDEPGAGYSVYSRRLLKQLLTYVRKKDRLGRDTGKTEAEEGAGNFDDLVIATALALCGRSDAWNLDASHLPPVHSNTSFKSNTGPTILTPDQAAVFQKQLVSKGGTSLLMPLLTIPDEVPEVSAQRQLDAFTLQLGCGIPISAGRPLITPPRYFYTRKK